MPDVDDRLIKSVADYARIDCEELELAESLICEALEYLETATNRVFAKREIVEYWDDVQDCYELSRYPVCEIVGAEVFDESSDQWEPLDISGYTEQLECSNPRIKRRCGECQSDCQCCPQRVRVRYVAGYECEAEWPKSVVRAVRLLVADWFRNRESGTIPQGVERIIATLKRRRFRK